MKWNDIQIGEYFLYDDKKPPTWDRSLLFQKIEANRCINFTPPTNSYRIVITIDQDTFETNDFYKTTVTENLELTLPENYPTIVLWKDITMQKSTTA